MKHILILLALALATFLNAAPLERNATAYASPDESAQVLGSLAKGIWPELAAADAPKGWIAVLVPGPHEVYVRNSDVGKNLDIKPGASLYAAPDISAPVLGKMERGDHAELSGLRGDWTLYKFTDAVTGFIRLASPALAAAAAAPAPAAPASVQSASSGFDPGSGLIPRFFEGRFSPTRGFIGFRHPYNFQILDNRGSRFAYLDVSRLLLTDRIENYEDRIVIVYGTARRLVDSRRKGIVIEVESLHLK